MSSYQPDFIERNGTWVLSVLGVCVSCLGAVLSYMLKSRCTKLKCCGFEIERDVLELGEVNSSVASNS